MIVDERPPRISRASFIACLAEAIATRTGFAAGKIGGSEQQLLYHPILETQLRNERQRRAAELVLGFHGETQCGLFPRDPAFYARFNDFFVEQLRRIDTLGLYGWPNEAAILRHYRLDMKVMNFIDQEPDRSVPDDPEACYLRHFRGKRVLLVSPFARLLAERAERATFEAVWAKTGKRWFAPAQVETVAVPWGYSAETRARFGDALTLFDHLAGEMAARRFDIALIGAGGLSLPLAVHAKALGAVGIALGGHLQVLFGVLGKRWRDRADWQRDYITPAWIDVPSEYRPSARVLADDGAYW